MGALAKSFMGSVNESLRIQFSSTAVGRRSHTKSDASTLILHQVAIRHCINRKVFPDMALRSRSVREHLLLVIK